MNEQKLETTAEEQIANAQAEGCQNASSGTYDQQRYSTSVLREYFDNGFVAQAASMNELPANTPMYLAGRIAFLKGLTLEAKPAGESFDGRWFSGWLVEKERAENS